MAGGNAAWPAGVVGGADGCVVCCHRPRVERARWPGIREKGADLESFIYSFGVVRSPGPACYVIGWVVLPQRGFLAVALGLYKRNAVGSMGGRGEILGFGRGDAELDKGKKEENEEK